MAKPLRTLRRQFAQQGLHLLFSFDNAMKPGTIVEIPKPRDVNHLGSLFKYKPVRDTVILGPTEVGLLDFSRTHELSIGGAADLVQSPKLNAKLRRVKTVKLSLDNPQKWYIADKIELFSLLSQDPKWPESSYAQTLSLRKHYLITEIVRTKLKFSFEGNGGITLNAQAVGLGNLKSVGIQTTYTWENEYELASKQPMVVAYEAVRWSNRDGRFRTLRV